MQTPANILLHTANADRRNRWLEMLEPVFGRVFLSVQEIAATAVVDVLVTDSSTLDNVLSERQEEFARGQIAVVAVDTPLAADVSLPADFSARELQLACRLLAEITKLRRRQQRGDHLHKALSQLAMSDPLTSLANRRAWEEELRSRVSDSHVDGQLLCLAMLDLDHFKQVNDRFGYVAGDEVLRTVAKVLSANVRTRDFVARYGGDEFALIVSDTLPESARAAIERTRQAVCAALAELPYGRLSASIGLAMIDSRNGTSPQDLFGAAERALRAAKTSGRDQTVIASTLVPPV